MDLELACERIGETYQEVTPADRFRRLAEFAAGLVSYPGIDTDEPAAHGPGNEQLHTLNIGEVEIVNGISVRISAVAVGWFGRNNEPLSRITATLSHKNLPYNVVQQVVGGDELSEQLESLTALEQTFSHVNDAVKAQRVEELLGTQLRSTRGNGALTASKAAAA